MSNELMFLCQRGIACCRTSVYNALESGQCEHYNDIISTVVKLMIKSQKLDIVHWECVCLMHGITYVLCCVPWWLPRCIRGCFICHEDWHLVCRFAYGWVHLDLYFWKDIYTHLSMTPLLTRWSSCMQHTTVLKSDSRLAECRQWLSVRCCAHGRVWTWFTWAEWSKPRSGQQSSSNSTWPGWLLPGHGELVENSVSDPALP